jgi:ABC-2 type transport system permease protein
MTDFIHRLLALIRKELLSVLMDKSSRAILIGPVIMQSLLFGYAATYDLSDAPYVLLDQSRSPTSAALLAKLDGTGFFRRVASVSSTTELEAAIDTQQALMAIRIDARFESQLLTGQTAPVQLILDARNSTTANAAASSVAAVVDAFNAERRAREGIAAPPLGHRDPRLVQPQLADALELHARADRHAEHAADPAADSAFGGA